MNVCEIYAAVTLSITTIWIVYARDFSFSTLAWAMFFPGLFAPWFAIEDAGFFQRVLGIDRILDAITYSLFGAGFAFFVVGAVYLFDILSGLGTVNPEAPKPLPEGSGDTLSGFCRAAGEEIGWRCYLLPCLMQHYSVFHAFLISGFVWGVYHIPVMILLTQKLNVPRPFLTILVQFLSVFLSAFPHGWVAVKSGYSLWAATMMHYTWNRINPKVLGSIYTQTPGWLLGQQWLINGEGLAGCVVLLPLSAVLYMDLAR